MEKITFQTLLDEQGGEPAYTPRPGLQYEVADGCVVAMKLPTVALQDAFIEATNARRQDVEVAKMVTEGEWPEGDLLVPQVVRRVVGDFGFFLMQISGLRPFSFAGSEPSMSTESTGTNP